MTTKQSITSGQAKQIVRFGSDAIEGALEEARLTKDGAQSVIEHGNELQQAIQKATRATLRDLSVTEKFANEEVSSTYNYHKAYKGPRWIAEQVSILQLLPELVTATYDEGIAKGLVPSGAEGWFAIPRWEKLASTYGEALERVFTVIVSKRRFYNCCEGKLSLEYLRQQAKTVEAFQKLGDEQKGHDILIVPCQFGLRHRGRSVRRAREAFAPNEFGLGVFAIACMLLTHPERLARYDDLWIDCPGDEYCFGSSGRFVGALGFSFHGGKLRLGSCWVALPYEYYGSVSGFLL